MSRILSATSAAVVVSMLAFPSTGCGGNRSASEQTAAVSQQVSVVPCKAGDLEIRLGRSTFAASNVGGYISFTNRSDDACSLSGWPTLIGVRSIGSSVTARRTRTTMFGPYRTRGIPIVTLRPMKHADVVFAGSDNFGPGSTKCPPPFRHFRVAPPRSSRSVVISAWLPALDAFMPSCSRIEVTMIVPSSALYRG
jgi:hypothetical protein